MENYSLLDIVNVFMDKVIDKLEQDYAPEKFKNLALELMQAIDFEGSKEQAREELDEENFNEYCNFVSMLPGIADAVSEDEYKSATIDLVRLVHSILVKYIEAWNLEEVVAKYLQEKEEPHDSPDPER